MTNIPDLIEAVETGDIIELAKNSDKITQALRDLQADREKLRIFIERGGIDSSAVLTSEDDGIWLDENECLQAQVADLQAVAEAADAWTSGLITDEKAFDKLCEALAKLDKP